MKKIQGGGFFIVFYSFLVFYLNKILNNKDEKKLWEGVKSYEQKK